MRRSNSSRQSARVLDCHSERREAKIMRERQRLSEIVVEAERAGERASGRSDRPRANG